MKSLRLLISAVAILMLAVPTLALAQTSRQIARSAVSSGHGGVLKLLARHNYADDMALLAYAHTDTVTTTDPTLTAAYSGCWGQNSDKHIITIAGIDLGWEKLVVGGFCWSGGALTSWGGDSAQRWSGFLYCWTNTNGPNDWWYARPTWRRAQITGELGGNSGFGCIGTQSDNDWMGYGLNNGSPAWIRH